MVIMIFFSIFFGGGNIIKILTSVPEIVFLQMLKVVPTWVRTFNLGWQAS
jgi:hypothetical protein